MVIIALAALIFGIRQATGDDQSQPTEPAPTASPQGEAAGTAPSPTAGGVVADPLPRALERAGGEMTPQIALDVFATMVGPVPGGEAYDPAPEVHATFAVTAIAEVWQELTTRQRDVIRDALSVPVEHVRGPPESAGGSASAASARFASWRRRIVALSQPRRPCRPRPEPGGFQRAINYLTDHLGRPPETPVYWSWTAPLNPRGSPGGDPPDEETSAAAYGVRCEGRRWVFEPGRDYEACLIVAGPRLPRASQLRQASLTHEAFHCRQLELLGSQSALAALPRWLWEASASWAQGQVEPRSVHDEYLDFLLYPNDLSQRLYDAIAVFEHLENSDVDLWSEILPLHREIAREIVSAPRRPSQLLSRAGTSTAVANILELASGTRFASTFASVTVQRATWGEGWFIDDSDAPAGSREREDLRTVTIGPTTEATRLTGRFLDDPRLYRIEVQPNQSSHDGVAVRISMPNFYDYGAVKAGIVTGPLYPGEDVAVCVRQPCCRGEHDASAALSDFTIAYTRWSVPRAGYGLPRPGEVPKVSLSYCRAERQAGKGEEEQDDERPRGSALGWPKGGDPIAGTVRCRCDRVSSIERIPCAQWETLGVPPPELNARYQCAIRVP